MEGDGAGVLDATTVGCCAGWVERLSGRETIQPIEASAMTITAAATA